MGEYDLKKRTRAFALRVIDLCEALPNGRTTRVIANQLLRCGTSVGANYRSASRAKSPADFIAKMAIVEEECDECLYWMALLVEANIVDDRVVSDLAAEADELLAIVVASIKTARRRAASRRARKQ